MKLEAMEVLKNRRSIRKYKQQQVSEAELKAVLEAGTYGATGRGTQSPFIVAVQNPETVKQLNRMNGAVMGNPDAEPYYGAPTVVLVFGSPEATTPFEDAMLVGANILNAAYAVGLGSCWIHRSRQMFETEEGKALLKAWNVPENCFGVASIALGYADCAHPEAKPRKENYYRIIK